jgi:hypothetical protein
MVEVERAKMTDMSDRDIRICDNKGFHMDLPNGVTVSVQLGPGNYCDSDCSNAAYDAPKNVEQWGSNLAECAAYLTDGDGLQWVDVPGYTDVGGDDVCGHLNVSQVLDFINLASQLNLGSGDYRDDPKIQEDERRVANEFAIDEFFSGLVKFSGTNYKDN